MRVNKIEWKLLGSSSKLSPESEKQFEVLNEYRLEKFNIGGKFYSFRYIVVNSFTTVTKGKCN